VIVVAFCTSGRQRLVEALYRGRPVVALTIEGTFSVFITGQAVATLSLDVPVSARWLSTPDVVLLARSNNGP
jgi:hypothetical protein